jgi:hypothetical protein
MVVGRYPIDPRTPNERGSASTRVSRIFARHPECLLDVPVWDEQEREGAAEGRSATPLSSLLGCGDASRPKKKTSEIEVASQ